MRRSRTAGWRSGALLVSLAVLSGCVVTAEPARPAAAQVERQTSRSVAVTDGETLRIENLAGTVELGRADGDQVEIVATVHAGGDNDGEARELAERVELRTEDGDDGPVVWLSYPIEDYDRFHYAGRQNDMPGFLAMFDNSSTSMRYRGRRVRVTSSRRGGAATVWVDLEIRVPSATRVSLLNGVGRVRAEGVVADLALRVHSGEIETVSLEGDLDLDTGSGSITVDGHRGMLRADTGSGGVDVRGVEGDVLVDTGSGSVRLDDVEATSVGVDTGSGGVTLERVTGSVTIDTGSGSVRLGEFSSGERISIETGSGRVRLQGDLSRAHQIRIETSSGSVTVDATAVPAMELRLSTGSGGIDVELPDLVVDEHDRHTFRGRSGAGATMTEVVIGTGSGGITIRRD